MTFTLTEDHANALADASRAPLRASTTRGNAWVSCDPPAVLRHERSTVARLLTAGYLASQRNDTLRITGLGMAALRAFERDRRARKFAGTPNEPAGAGAATDAAPRAA